MLKRENNKITLTASIFLVLSALLIGGLFTTPPAHGAAVIKGCMDVTADNYNPLALLPDPQNPCEYRGCMDVTALNYDVTANVDDGSCTYPAIIPGCMDATADNYEPTATIDDGSCIYTVLGCTDAVALNYDALATVDDGSCTYAGGGGGGGGLVCETGSSSSGVLTFDAANYTFNNVTVNADSNLEVDYTTAVGSVDDLGNLPFRQDITVDFTSLDDHDWAFNSFNFGWFYLEDAYDNGDPATGTLVLPPIDAKRHHLFYEFWDYQEDDWMEPFREGDGVFDYYIDTEEDYDGDGLFPPDWDTLYFGTPTAFQTEADLEAIGFETNGDGVVDTRDMKKRIGPFQEGSQIVFFLQLGFSYYYFSADALETDYAFTGVQEWYNQTYPGWPDGTDQRLAGALAPVDFELDQAVEADDPYFYFGWNGFVWGDMHSFCDYDDVTDIFSDCDYGTYTTPGPNDLFQNGWLNQDQLDRLNNFYGIAPTGTITNTYTQGVAFNHMVLGGDPTGLHTQILGVEMSPGGEDYPDFHDVLLLVGKVTGGTAELTTAIEPTIGDSTITTITFEVVDTMPNTNTNAACEGTSRIEYSISINDGATWTPITDWGIVRNTNTAGAIQDDWTNGSPETTYRMATLDMLEYSRTGRLLKWKIDMYSSDTSCVPEVASIDVSYTASSTDEYSRAGPTVLGNVIYAGAYETAPDNDATWTESDVRGHFRSQQIYDPITLISHVGSVVNWDAADQMVAGRTIKYGSVSRTVATDEILDSGDDVIKTFTATLANTSVQFSSLTITDGVETFTDSGVNKLTGDLGGYGTINRDSGEYSVTFNDAPAFGTDNITATYTYLGSIASITTLANQALNHFALTDDFYFYYNVAALAEGRVYEHDFDGDGIQPSLDDDHTWLEGWVAGFSDGNAAPKEWFLSSIDHSQPAIAGAPGAPQWYFGLSTTDDERDSWNEFRCNEMYRDTVTYIGDRMGQVHAFDAGSFRPYYIDITTYTDSSNGGTDTCANDYDTFVSAVNANNTDSNGEPYHPDWAGQPKINRGYYDDCTNGSCTSQYGTGSEIWSYIPSNLTAKLKNNALYAPDQASVDASPAVEFIYDKTASAWKVVLLGTQGSGGSTIYALDVTSEGSAPSLMWEYSDPRLHGGEHAPTIGGGGRVSGADGATWRVFVSAGFSTATTDPAVVFNFKIDTGSVTIHTLPDSNGATISGSPTLVDSDYNGYIDRAYVTTDAGFVYKITIPDDPLTTSTAYSVCKIFNAGQPIYASPAAYVQSSINSSTGEYDPDVTILFGTGDDPKLADNISDQFFFYAVQDLDAKGDCNMATETWSYALPAGQRVYASAVASAGYVYFGTSTADTEDPCAAAADGSSDEGNIYAIDVATGTNVTTAGSGNFTSTPTVSDEHLYIRKGSGDIESFGGSEYQNDLKRGGTGNAHPSNWREVTY